MRRLIQFTCAGEELVATLDGAVGTTGLLIVSGGNEIRIGAHRGMAELAANIAAAGYPVFRYDRRGIGDSSGINNGFEGSSEDIREAVAAFRREVPHLTRIVAFGNCDAASALILFHAGAAIDGLVITNPWTIEAADDLPPAAAIRSRYIEKLKNPRELLRLMTGGVNIRKLIGGLVKASSNPSQASNSLPARLARAFESSTIPITILLAERDNTAVAFVENWQHEAFAAYRARTTLHRCDTDSHSFARPQDKAWLVAQVLAALSD
ncbi:hydrolase 1, exosortase A system-associated [Sphingomonas turrisvirgatae]|uniref:Hydrolase 1, exosortase A system-associated n=1 Tax=Sphingomonas turrisvirgatae TaxID=1888892 RepID=A0A1E3LSS6_9SPHN|nr:hydrolase 1, exosortase A system-associated [Sphingomonas turrisvirgatae]ODP36848.1 hydrolase 1, exosortase A system-associated [Sphingomonas turrisvirgatae]